MIKKIYNNLLVVLIVIILCLNFLIIFLPNTVSVFPVDDGGVIQLNVGESPIFHISSFNIQKINKSNEQVLEGIGVNTLKNIHYPVFPSHSQSYNVFKIFNNSKDNVEVHMNIRPSITSNRINVSEVLVGLNAQPIRFGIEMLQTPMSSNSLSNNLEIKFAKCTSIIYSKNTPKIEGKYIWLTTEENKIQFDIETKCQK